MSEFDPKPWGYNIQISIYVEDRARLKEQILDAFVTENPKGVEAIKAWENARIALDEAHFVGVRVLEVEEEPKDQIGT